MTSATRPPIGARLTWTSSGDRKMETRVDEPTNGSTASSTPRTRPSAGESTPLGTTGISRSGSRKNPTEASEAAQNGSASRRRPVSVRPAAITADPTMNGQPSDAIGSFLSMLTSFVAGPASPPRAAGSLFETRSHPWRFDPRHHRAQPLAHFLDLVVGVAAAHRQEARTVGLVLQDPFARELSRLDFGQHLLPLPLPPLPHPT